MFGPDGWQNITAFIHLEITFLFVLDLYNLPLLCEINMLSHKVLGLVWHLCRLLATLEQWLVLDKAT